MNMTKDLDLRFSYRLRVWHRRLLEKKQPLRRNMQDVGRGL